MDSVRNLRAHQRWLLRSAGRVISPPGARARLLILIYHRVLARPDPLRPRGLRTETFRWHMSTLADCFNVLPLGEAVHRLKAGTLPARAAAVTFDDGYVDNHDVALPILQKFGIAATFFITTGTMGRCMWNDAVVEAVRHAPNEFFDATALGLEQLPVSTHEEKRAAIRRILDTLKGWRREDRDDVVVELLDAAGISAPSGMMMGPTQIKALRVAGMDIGAHTVTHPILAHTTPDEAEYELGASRETLERLLGEKVGLFAYPNGRPGIDYLDEHVHLVRRLGFDAAVSTARGANRTGRADPCQLRRFTPWDRQPARFAARMLMQSAGAAWKR